MYLLIVDDEAFIRNLLIQTLSKFHGINVLDAENGKRALEILEQHGDETCVLVTDHDMPVMSGENLIAETKEKFPKIKSLLLSGRLTQLDVDEMKEPFKPDLFLAKPFTTGVIRMLVALLISHFKMDKKKMK